MCNFHIYVLKFSRIIFFSLIFFSSLVVFFLYNFFTDFLLFLHACYLDPELIGVCRVQWQICYFFILLVPMFFGPIVAFWPK